MGYSQGSYGKLSIFDDFFACPAITGTSIRGTVGSEGIWYSSVGVSAEITAIVSETGGVLRINNCTNDNDNFFIHAGPFQPVIGGCQMEARIKMASVSMEAVFVGFAETSIIDATTPSMPIELATATLSGHSTGGAAGMLFDYDATTKDFFAVATDANTPNSAVGTGGVDSGIAPVSDRWDVIRVEIDETGKATMKIADHAGALKVVKVVPSAVNPSDLFFAVVGMESRSETLTSETLMVDYIAANGHRDWQTS